MCAPMTTRMTLMLAMRLLPLPRVNVTVMMATKTTMSPNSELMAMSIVVLPLTMLMTLIT